MKLAPYPKYKDSGVEWLGEMPEGWEMKRLKWAARLEYGSSLSGEARKEGSVPVYGSNGIVGEHSMSITSKPVIIIGRKGSYGKVSYSEVPCFPIDTTYYIDSSLTKENIRWLYYLLGSITLDEITFDTGVPGLSREFAYAKIVPVPSKNEQTAIANYLDQKTAKIDELIKKNKRLVELLKEKRQALISHAVTKGLDPEAKMKDSGIEWIGKIPEGWEVKRLRYISKSVKTGVTPPSENLEYYDEGDIDWYTPGDFGEKLELMSSSKKITALAIKNRVARIFEKGTILLVGIGATLGKIALTHKQASLNQQINAIVLEERFIPKFYAYYLNSVKDIIISLSNAATLGIINQERTKQIICLVPPKDEQTAIANFLDQKTARIDDLTQNIQSQIETLKEYRQVLISNVVTGKIDVKEEQP